MTVLAGIEASAAGSTEFGHGPAPARTQGAPSTWIGVDLEPMLSPSKSNPQPSSQSNLASFRSSWAAQFSSLGTESSGDAERTSGELPTGSGQLLRTDYRSQARLESVVPPPTAPTRGDSMPQLGSASVEPPEFLSVSVSPQTAGMNRGASARKQTASPSISQSSSSTPHLAARLRASLAPSSSSVPGAAKSALLSVQAETKAPSPWSGRTAQNTFAASTAASRLILGSLPGKHTPANRPLNSLARNSRRWRHPGITLRGVGVCPRPRPNPKPKPRRCRPSTGNRINATIRATLHSFGLAPSISRRFGRRKSSRPESGMSLGSRPGFGAQLRNAIISAFGRQTGARQLGRPCGDRCHRLGTASPRESQPARRSSHCRNGTVRKRFINAPGPVGFRIAGTSHRYRIPPRVPAKPLRPSFPNPRREAHRRSGLIPQA